MTHRKSYVAPGPTEAARTHRAVRPVRYQMCPLRPEGRPPRRRVGHSSRAVCGRDA